MNASIRRLSVVVLLMFLALMGSSTWVQFFSADELNDDSRNLRTLYREFGTFRGPIVVDGEAVASSVPVDDEYDYQRVYADGDLYAPVTGFYSIVYGRSGIESAENRLLNGSSDSLFWTRFGDLLAGREQQGAAVELTIRSAIQETAAASLGDQAGAVIALDPRTGEILAMVSSPSYDPALLANHDRGQVITDYRTLEADDSRPLDNRAIGGNTYPPGSVFKLVVTAAALEAGYDPETLLRAPQEMELPLTVETLENYGRGTCAEDDVISLADALRISCNTAFGDVALGLGWGPIARKAEEFGWNDSSLRIPLTVAPSRLPEDPDEPQSVYSAIGQFDVRATPLQVAMVGSAIANGGVLMEPYLVAEVRNSDLAVVEIAEPTVYSTPLTHGDADLITEMMVAVVEDGTGKAARIDGVSVAGKTGTAETGTDEPPHAWFVAFAPAENPVVVVAVVVENGGDLGQDATGGRVAAPIARDVLAAALVVEAERVSGGTP